MIHQTLTVAVFLLSCAHGQLVGTSQAEVHPGMTWQSCTAKNSCATNNGKIVIDSNWRWLHDKNRYVNLHFDLNCHDSHRLEAIPTVTLGILGTARFVQTTNLVLPIAHLKALIMLVPMVSLLVAALYSLSLSRMVLIPRTLELERT